MAFQMSYRDSAGRVNEASYWVVSAIQVKPIEKTGLVIFNGYVDQETYTANGIQPIATKTYTLTPDNWGVALASMGLNVNNLMLVCYRLALMTKEGDPPADGEDDTRTSFFATAVQV